MKCWVSKVSSVRDGSGTELSYYMLTACRVEKLGTELFYKHIAAHP